MGLPFTLTPEGRAALRNPEGDGTRAVRVVAIGVTAASFTSGDPLPEEYKRITTISGGATAPDTIHVTVTDDTEGEVYSVRGFGFYLDDGTLLGSYGDTKVIVEKSAASSMQVAVDAQFAETDATQITFGDTNFMNPAATTETLGVVALATPDQAIAGKDAQHAITPSTLRSAINSRFGVNAPSALAKALLALLTAEAFRDAIGPEFPPEPHRHAMADIDGLIEALASKVETRSRFVPGQIIVSAAKSAPPETLLCNGAAISRTEYAALFAAIGTTYGDGDGDTTFNIPQLAEGSVIKATLDPVKVGTYSAGSVLTHTHTATATNDPGHTHSVTITAAGKHGHSASTNNAGEHAHAAWTDQQGYHAHGGATTISGNHGHVMQENVVVDLGGSQGNIAYRGDASGARLWSGGGWRSPTGGDGVHNHALSTDGNGTHGHNIGMNAGGGHAHTVLIGDVGNHNHDAEASSSDPHTHTIAVSAIGGSANLAAGTYMFHFIAY